MDDTMKESRPKLKKLQIGYQKLKGTSITECAHADNVVVMACKETDLGQNLQIWNDVLSMVWEAMDRNPR